MGRTRQLEGIGVKMNVLHEPVPKPHGMSHEESDALCHDLRAEGIEVRRVEEP
jgi:hypothetical protein